MRLITEESYGINQFFDFLPRESFQGFGSKRPVTSGEKPLHRTRRAGIFGSRGKNRPHENAKRIMCLRFDELDNRGGMFDEFLFKSLINSGDFLKYIH